MSQDYFRIEKTVHILIWLSLSPFRQDQFPPDFHLHFANHRYLFTTRFYYHFHHHSQFNFFVLNLYQAKLSLDAWLIT